MLSHLTRLMPFVDTLKAWPAAMLLVFAVTGCANTPPLIRTNERPSILDHRSVLSVCDHDPEETTNQFLDAIENNETFGFCLPIGSPREEIRPVACFITEVGEVYVIIDRSQGEEPDSLYEIGPAVRKSETRYYLPLVDVEMEFKRR